MIYLIICSIIFFSKCIFITRFLHKPYPAKRKNNVNTLLFWNWCFYHLFLMQNTHKTERWKHGQCMDMFFIFIDRFVCRCTWQIDWYAEVSNSIDINRFVNAFFICSIHTHYYMCENIEAIAPFHYMNSLLKLPKKCFSNFKMKLYQ